MAAPSRTLRLRGTAYPVLLPTLRDPRLHLAGVIVSLQILGQVAFDFRLSIAQILVSLITCAVLFWFGSTFGASTVKGFAITLAIGVILSMFSAVWVTRTLMRVLLASGSRSLVESRTLLGA